MDSSGEGVDDGSQAPASGCLHAVLSCNQCNRPFHSHVDLIQHRLQALSNAKTDANMPKCDLCLSIFNDVQSLHKHYINQHSINLLKATLQCYDSTQNLSNSQSSADSQNLIDSHNLTDSHSLTDSQNLNDSQNLTDSQNLDDSQNLNESQNLTDSQSFTTSENLSVSQNSTVSPNLTSLYKSNDSQNVATSMTLKNCPKSCTIPINREWYITVKSQDFKSYMIPINTEECVKSQDVKSDIIPGNNNVPNDKCVKSQCDKGSNFDDDDVESDIDKGDNLTLHSGVIIDEYNKVSGNGVYGSSADVHAKGDNSNVDVKNIEMQSTRDNPQNNEETENTGDLDIEDLSNLIMSRSAEMSTEKRFNISEKSDGDIPKKSQKKSQKKSPKKRLRKHSGKKTDDFYFRLKSNDVDDDEDSEGVSYVKTTFECLQCVYEADTKKGIIRHMAHCHDDFSVGKNSVGKNGVMSLSEYTSQHETGTSARRFQCTICTWSFGSRIALLKHMLIHNGDKNYVCLICKKGFKTVENLQQHHATHIKTAYRCQQCEFVSSYKSQIREHRQIHKNVGCLVCDVCGTVHPNKSSLVRHRRVHDTDRPYSCDFTGCTLRFKSVVMRNAHFRSHNRATDDEEYSCDLCGYSFRHKHHLRRHEKGVHKLQDFECKKFKTLPKNTVTKVQEEPQDVIVVQIDQSVEENYQPDQSYELSDINIAPLTFNVAAVPQVFSENRINLTQDMEIGGLGNLQTTENRVEMSQNMDVIDLTNTDDTQKLNHQAHVSTNITNQNSTILRNLITNRINNQHVINKYIQNNANELNIITTNNSQANNQNTDNLNIQCVETEVTEETVDSTDTPPHSPTLVELKLQSIEREEAKRLKESQQYQQFSIQTCNENQEILTVQNSNNIPNIQTHNLPNQTNQQIIHGSSYVQNVTYEQLINDGFTLQGTAPSLPSDSQTLIIALPEGLEINTEDVVYQA